MRPRSSRPVCWVVMAFALLPQVLRAQGRGTSELGIDLGAEASFRRSPVIVQYSGYSMVDYSTLLDQRLLPVEVPSSDVRFGYWLSNSIEIEPSLGFLFHIRKADAHYPSVTDFVATVGFALNCGRISNGVSPFFGTGVLTKYEPEPRYTPAYTLPTTRLGIPLHVGLRVPAGSDLAVRVVTGATWWLDEFASYWSVDLRLGVSMLGRPSKAGASS